MKIFKGHNQQIELNSKTDSQQLKIGMYVPSSYPLKIVRLQHSRPVVVSRLCLRAVPDTDILKKSDHKIINHGSVWQNWLSPGNKLVGKSDAVGKRCSPACFANSKVSSMRTHNE